MQLRFCQPWLNPFLVGGIIFLFVRAIWERAKKNVRFNRDSRIEEERSDPEEQCQNESFFFLRSIKRFPFQSWNLWKLGSREKKPLNLSSFGPEFKICQIGGNALKSYRLFHRKFRAKKESPDIEEVTLKFYAHLFANGQKLFPFWKCREIQKTAMITANDPLHFFHFCIIWLLLRIASSCNVGDQVRILKYKSAENVE